LGSDAASSFKLMKQTAEGSDRAVYLVRWCRLQQLSSLLGRVVDDALLLVRRRRSAAAASTLQALDTGSCHRQA